MNVYTKITTVTMINVHIEDATRNEDGTWTLTIPSRPPSAEEQKLLQRMFPHTLEEVHQLLDRELLIGSIVTE